MGKKYRVLVREPEFRDIKDNKEFFLYCRLPYKQCKKDLLYNEKKVDFTAAAGRSFSMIQHYCPYCLDGFYVPENASFSYVLSKLHWFCYSCGCCLYKPKGKLKAKKPFFLSRFGTNFKE